MGVQEMREQNRLGMLHVRHARHRNLKIIFALLEKRHYQPEQSLFDFVNGVHDEQTEIRGDEFIAAAAGVEFPA